MPVVPFHYTPFPVHLPFHLTRVREKAAIGAVGSGKTIALCGDALLLGLQQPGSKILIARQSIPSLRVTTENEFLSLMQALPEDMQEDRKAKTLYDLSNITRSGGHTDQIILPNGTEYYFRSLDDWRKLMSLNLCAFYIDEASEVDSQAYLALLTRLRQTKPTQMAQRLGYRTIQRQVGALCTNPNGHDWIWEYFVHAPELARESGDPAKIAQVSDRRYFRSTSFDNPMLYENGTPNAYLRSLLNMPEVWLKRYVLCEFDAFEGQIYPFVPERHIVEHFQPPQNWDRAMGLDWGLRNPTAVVWWARAPGSEQWIQYREWQTYDPTDPYQKQSYETMDVHQICERIKQIENGERIKYRVADPAIKQRMGESGKSVHYWMNHYGMHFAMGMKKYDDRINAMTQMIQQGKLVFMRNCPQTAIAIQQYRWADLATGSNSDGPERPVKKNDHLVNAAEYLSTYFMTPPKITEEPTIPTFHDEIHSSIRKQMGLKRKMNRKSVLY